MEKHWLEIEPPVCPYCHRKPALHSCAKGDVIECENDDCPRPEDEPPLQYTTIAKAVTNWIDYCAKVALNRK